MNCQFCAFKRQRWEADAYTHGLDVVLGKVDEAIARGATEVCMQGGINPDMDAVHVPGHPGRHQGAPSRAPRARLLADGDHVRRAAHRTSPTPTTSACCATAGSARIPGTAAEILDDEVREILSHKKVDVRTWIEIITTAHRLGMPTTSTVMYGHVETPAHVARHLDLMRTHPEGDRRLHRVRAARLHLGEHAALPRRPRRAAAEGAARPAHLRRAAASCCAA